MIGVPTPGPGYSNAYYRTQRIKIPLSGQEGRRLVDVLNQFFAYNPCLTLRDVKADVRYSQRYSDSNALFTLFYSVPIGTRYFVEEFFGDANVTAAARAEYFLEQNDTLRVMKVVDVSSASRSLSNEQRLLIFYIDESHLYETDLGMSKAGVPGSAGGDIAVREGAIMGDPVNEDRPAVWVWNYGERPWPAGAPFIIFKTEDRLNEWGGVPPCCYGDKGSQGPFDLFDLCGIPGDFGAAYTTFLTTTFTSTTTAPLLPNLRFGSNKPTSFSTTTTQPPASAATQFARIGDLHYLQDFDIIRGNTDFISVAGGSLQIASNAAYVTPRFSGDPGLLLVGKTPILGDFDITVNAKTSEATGSFALLFDYVDDRNFSYYTYDTNTGAGRNRFVVVRDGIVAAFSSDGGASTTLPLAAFALLRLRRIGDTARVYLNGSLIALWTDTTLLSKGRVGIAAASTSGAGWACSSFSINGKGVLDACRRTTYVCSRRRNVQDRSTVDWKIAEVECVGNEECSGGAVCTGDTYVFEEINGCTASEPVNRLHLPAVPDTCVPTCGSSCYQVTSYWIEDDEKECTQITSEIDTALTNALGTKVRGTPERIVTEILRGRRLSVLCSTVLCNFEHTYEFPRDPAFTQPTVLEELTDPGGEIVVAIGFEEKAWGEADGTCPRSIQQYRSLQILVTLVPTGEVCDE